MKKKIKDLTVKEIKAVCKANRHCSVNCPFFDHQWLCLGLKNMKKSEMESEVEVDE